MVGLNEKKNPNPWLDTWVLSEVVAKKYFFFLKSPFFVLYFQLITVLPPSCHPLGPIIYTIPLSILSTVLFYGNAGDQRLSADVAPFKIQSQQILKNFSRN